MILFGPFIFRRQLQRTADLFNKVCQLARRLRCDGLNVPLKDEKVLGLDENIMRDECGIVRAVRDDFAVEFVL